MRIEQCYCMSLTTTNETGMPSLFFPQKVNSCNAFAGGGVDLIFKNAPE